MSAEQKTTFTKAFINPYPHPINVGPIPHLGGGSIQVDPGKPIINRAGVPINDPIFERYVRPNGLQREVSPTPVPIVPCPRPRIVGRDGVGFTGTSMHGSNRPTPPAKSETGVIAFQNFRDAERAGFVRRGQMAPESRITETTGVPPDALFESRETLANTTADKDVSNRPTLDGRPMAPKMLTVPPKETINEDQSQKIRLPPGTPKGIPMAVVGREARQPEPPPQPQPVKAAEEEIPGFTPPQPAQAALVETADEIPGFSPPENLPAPTLAQPGAGPADPPASTEEAPTPSEAGGKRRYSCPICSSEKTVYQFRSQLNDHVKRHHPDQAEAVMNLIPKSESAFKKKAKVETAP